MIEILLPTHNGEKYIAQQLDSLLNQTYRDFHITVYDDNSTDGTKSVISKYINKFPFKISELITSEASGSACRSFDILLKNCESDYAALCDQDDIWKKDKLFYEITKMEELERLHGKDTPLLVHSDLSITDEKMKILHKSFFSYKSLPKKNKMSKLLVQNNVTGCTCLLNKSLCIISGNIPKAIKIHDWWIALIACCFGEIGFVDKTLVLYRQHNNNTIGAYNCIKGKAQIKNSMSYSYSQAKKYLLVFSEDIPVTKFKIIASYACFPIKSKLYRINNIIFHGYNKKSIIKKLGQLWYC